MRLGSQQENILRWLLQAMAEGWTHNWDMRRWVWVKYIRRCIFPSERPLSPSERASFSRSLKRLEQQELIKRTNEVSGGKQTTSITLTQHGLEVARDLARQYLDEHPEDHRAKSLKAALAADVELKVLE